jgi:hypothetical protein
VNERGTAKPGLSVLLLGARMLIGPLDECGPIIALTANGCFGRPATEYSAWAYPIPVSLPRCSTSGSLAERRRRQALLASLGDSKNQCGAELRSGCAPDAALSTASGGCTGRHAIRTAASGRLGLGPAALSATPSRNMKVASQPGMSVNFSIAGAMSSAPPRIAVRSTHSTG